MHGRATKDLYRCKQSRIEGRARKLPATYLEVEDPSQILQKILTEVAGARCLACQDIAKAIRAEEGM